MSRNRLGPEAGPSPSPTSDRARPRPYPVGVVLQGPVFRDNRFVSFVSSAGVGSLAPEPGPVCRVTPETSQNPTPTPVSYGGSTHEREPDPSRPGETGHPESLPTRRLPRDLPSTEFEEEEGLDPRPCVLGHFRNQKSTSLVSWRKSEVRPG